MKYTAIRSEGGLLPYDLLDEILAEIAPGQKPADFGLPKGRRVSDEIQRVWSDALELWSRFQAGREKLPEKDPHGTTLTRDRWIGPLLTDPVRLSYDLHYQPSAVVLEGLTFAISHRAGEPADSPPVHIEGCEIELDKRPPKYRTSPQAMVQEFLNRSEPHLWGVVTNGLRFRLLRDSVRTARPTYLEFDLETILEGVLYNEFALFYRLCHRTRLPQPGHPPEDCLLETYYLQSIEKGGRVRDNLRDGVEEALKVLGTGFLRHPDNVALRERIDSSALNADQFHRQLLLLVYRLLFLTVAEDRRLIISIGEDADRNQTIYRDYYSIGRLRDRAEGMLEDSGFGDLWLGLTQTFKLFADSNDTNPLGISPLNGDLFSQTTIPDLEAAHLSNLDLLRAVRWLMFYRERNVQQRVNYAALNVEELGSVYESLLDFRPMVSNEPEGRKFELGVGSERKATGSYYTRPELVRELIQSALVPVMEDRLAEAEKLAKGQSSEAIRNAKGKAILDISVCDPACGSGHFILEAARRLGKELARIRVGEDEPTPEQFHIAVRDVISHCIHGVDLNPLAVDLCKLALWLEGHWAGKPLSFLDHRIRCGNSLIGVLDPSIMTTGIPDEAFNPVTGDDKKIAAAYKRRNRAEHSVGQKRLEFEQAPARHSEEYAELFGIRLDFPEDKPSDVKRKAELFEKARGGADWWHDWTAANLWTASFFVPLRKLDDPLIPTQEIFSSYLLHRKDRPQMTGLANSLAGELRFFHWHLEFPDVFEKGGFDVVLGNPPWDKIKLSEEEHWIDDAYISDASSRAVRTKRIEEYRKSGDPAKKIRVEQFDHSKRINDGTLKFIRFSQRFPSTAVGDINTFAVFSELTTNVARKAARIGIIVPTGIATDESCSLFFDSIARKGSLVSLFDFENRNAIFPGVHRSYKFSLLTIQPGDARLAGRFAFFLGNTSELNDSRRQFTLTSEDIALLNPNTRTCPIFRSKQDALLTQKLYQTVPVLINNTTSENGWGVTISRMFHMSDDAALFLEEDGEDRLPLYEAKLFHQFDHRWATFENGTLRDCKQSEKEDLNFKVTPRYWVSRIEVLLKAIVAPDGFIEAFRSGSADQIVDQLQSWFQEELRKGNAEWLRADLRAAIETTANGDSLEGLERLICEFEPKSGETWELTKGHVIDVALALIEHRAPPWLLGFRQNARATDERTFIAAVLPFVAVSNSIYLFNIGPENLSSVSCFAANLNSLVLDYVVRQKVGGINLSYYFVEQFPILAPTSYTTEDHAYITPRVESLVKSSRDVATFGNSGLTRWSSDQRARNRAELDAYYAHLYGLTRDELRYILDPKDVFGEDFPSETFRVLKEGEEKELGEYLTGRLVLAFFDELAMTNRFKGEKRVCRISGKDWTVGN